MIKLKIQRGDILKKVIALFVIIISIIGGILVHYKITSNIGEGHVTITFDIEGEVTTYDVLRGTKLDFPTPPVKEGYTFVGWDNDASLDIITKDQKYKAIYEKNEYTISFNSNSMDNYENIVLTYNDDLPTLPTPIKEGYEFAGWYYEGVLFDNKTMPAYDVKLEGLWYSTITFTDVEGIKFDKIKAAPYDKISAPIVKDENKRVGEIIVWYTDHLFQNPFSFYKMPTDSITLYGRFEKIENIDEGFFVNLVDEQLDNTVDSRKELLEYLEYLVFYKKSGEHIITLNYSVSNISSVLIELFEELNINRDVDYKYQRQGNNLVLSLSFEEEASLKASLTDLYQQQECVETLKTGKRDPEFNSFPIDLVDKTIKVYDSEQLYIALERGYKPLFNQNDMSDVYKIYYEAKYILKNIISDDMTDFEKVHAIYDWLVINITYDARLKEYVEADIDNINKYRGFYLEGALLDKRAVCDGISKAFVVMCRIEGIEAIRITGASLDNTFKHAWNKVRINNEWFTVDATSGGMIIKENEALNHKFLLVDDNYYGSLFVAYDYTNFVSYGKYDIYQEMYYQENKDFNITSQKELNDIISWYVSNYSVNTTIDMRISFDYGDSLDDELLQSIKINGIKDFQISISKNGTYLDNGVLFILGYQK